MPDRKLLLAGGTPSGPRRSRHKTYFVANEDGHIKIGKAIDPVHRLKCLQTGSAQRLKILYVINNDVEAHLHKRFAHLRKSGEWFEASPALLAFIDRLRHE
jgi:Meiotically up-regulated gene 113